ncbi:MAG: ABC transporter ATP-binding protein [Pseudomonadota bacterium]
MKNRTDPAPLARLTLNGVTRRLGGRSVVDDVSLQVAAGQVTCLLGPSGCGKSTTLRLIAGVDRPDDGLIEIDGTPVSASGAFVAPEHRGVGLMFQDFALFPHLSVRDNVAFGLKGGRTERFARADEMIERVELTPHAGDFPHHLSGGEQQRVALARALAPRPKVMLMDEPFSGLDNRLRDGIRDQTLAILKDEGAAVLLVTHEPDEAMRMGDEIALMRDGKIVQQGAPYDVYNRPIDRDAAAFFSDLNGIDAVASGERVETAFGAFDAPGFADGTPMQVVIRPQHLRIDFDRGGRGPNPTPEDGTPVRGTVARSRYMGRESLVEFTLDEGSDIRASVPSVFLPKRGTVMWLMLRRKSCFVFPKTAAGQ